MNYLHIYESIISKAKSENRTKRGAVYYESHHIYPNCWCVNELEYLKTDMRNLALLTGKEHYTAHHLLIKIYPNSTRMIYAFWAMNTLKIESQHRTKPTSRQYETARTLHAQEVSSRIVTEETRKKLSIIHKGKVPWNKGLTKDTSDIIMKSAIEMEGFNSGENHPFYGKKRPEHSEKMKIIMKGVKKSDTHKENISKSHNIVHICPHCGKSGGRIMFRWHFDKCKLKN